MSKTTKVLIVVAAVLFVLVGALTAVAAYTQMKQVPEETTPTETGSTQPTE